MRARYRLYRLSGYSILGAVVYTFVWRWYN